MFRKSDDKTKAERQPMTRTALEGAITERVKNSSAECEEFVGVIIEYVKPEKLGDANWGLKGVRYGKANREACAAALSALVAEGQLEFELSDPHA
jgi:hypothetical protein